MACTKRSHVSKMAAPMKWTSSVCILSRQLMCTTPSLSGAAVQVRCKSKSANNKTSRTPGQRLGWKRQDHQFVHAGELLVKQKSLRYYPGENVKFGTLFKSLYACTDGTVVISSEKLSPHPNSPLYEPVKNGLIIHKKFFHIIPTPVHAKFRLISET